MDADFFIVHAKTAAQGSSEPADDSVYPECVDAAGGRPVIANGDIDTTGAVEKFRGMGVQGIMMGRAAIRNPPIFDEVKNDLGLNSPKKITPNRSELMDEYRQLSKAIGSPAYSDSFAKLLGRETNVVY